MESAVAEYRAARTGTHHWLLGRFVVTASRLGELGGLLMRTMTSEEEPWALSVILDGEVAGAAVLARDFSAEMEPAAQIAMLEVPLPPEVSDGRSEAAAADAARPTLTAALTASPVATPFFELRRGASGAEGLRAGVAALARLREEAHRPLGGKLRCGGLDADSFPAAEEVAVFIAECTARNLPYKATAGLHHPIRHFDADIGVTRHGFLNLLVAGALARAGHEESALIEAINDEDAANFALGAAGLRWKEHTIRVGDISMLRSQFAGYGSCSFAEPVEDLTALGMLRPVE